MNDKAAARIANIIKELSARLAGKVDSDFTGVLKIEVNMSQGSVARVFIDDREELKL